MSRYSPPRNRFECHPTAGLADANQQERIADRPMYLTGPRRDAGGPVLTTVHAMILQPGGAGGIQETPSPGLAGCVFHPRTLGSLEGAPPGGGQHGLSLVRGAQSRWQL